MILLLAWPKALISPSLPWRAWDCWPGLKRINRTPSHDPCHVGNPLSLSLLLPLSLSATSTIELKEIIFCLSNSIFHTMSSPSRIVDPELQRRLQRGKPISLRAQPRPIETAPPNPLPLIRCPSAWVPRGAPRVQPGNRGGSRKSVRREGGRPPASCPPSPRLPTGQPVQPPKHVADHANHQPANVRSPLPFPCQCLKQETAPAKIKKSSLARDFLKKAGYPISTGDAANKAETVSIGSDVSRSPLCFRFHCLFANERTRGRPHEQMNRTSPRRMQRFVRRNVPSKIRVASSRVARHECPSNVSVQAPLSASPNVRLTGGSAQSAVVG